MVSCTIISALFVGAVVCAILGNLAGAIAWRRRRPELGAWGWMTNPLALLRSSNFAEPNSPARLIALGLQFVGAIALCFLAVILIQMQRGGAASVCGYAF